MRTVSFVFLLFALQVSALAEGADARHAAIEWATEHRAVAYDALMAPAAAEGISVPTCRVTTLRSSGSVDTFEYVVRVTEPCDSFNEKGTVVRGEPTGEFIIADASPLTAQLAAIRFAEPSITLERALSQLRVNRQPLSRDAARAFLHEIRLLSVNVLPPLKITLDGPLYELTSATRMAARSVEVNAASTAGERRVGTLARRIASRLGYGPQQLWHDASVWN